MKKIALIFMSILIAFNLIFPPDVAHANLASKPLTIAAKKVAKDVVKDTAVEMANQIVSDFLVKELLEGVNTDKGYTAVCMSGKKDNIKDCAPDKRAQIKTDLSSTDKKNLESKVEQALERKTHTSSKWAKFLDIFIPLFLVSGAIEFISSALDGDILSFFDEIAQDALIDSGLLKPLGTSINLPGDFKPKNFSEYVKSATVEREDINDDVNLDYFVYLRMKLTFFDYSKSFDVKYVDNYGKTQTKTISNSSGSTWVVNYSTYIPWENNGSAISGKVNVSINSPVSVYSRDIVPYLWDSGIVKMKKSEMFPIVTSQMLSILSNVNYISNSSDVNDVINTYFNAMSTFYPHLTVNLPDLPVEHVKTDYGKQTATEKIKDADGKIKMRGMNTFNFKYGDTNIFPSDQSKTGWKNKTTGEDITVVEDDVVVEDATDGTGPPDGTDEGTELDKDKEKEDLQNESESLGKLVTTRFPFSLPWDFMALLKLLYAEPMTPKWEVKGTEDIPLDFTIDLKFLDPYAPWFRGFVLIGFIFGVIFMHSRFMGGSK